MACKEETLGSLIDGGTLTIYFNNKELHKTSISAPYLGGEKNADTTIINEDNFYDEFGNSYTISIYSSMYNLSYSIELYDTENEEKSKIVCDGLRVEVEPYNPNKDEENYDYEEEPYIEPTKFFTIKTSQEQGIKKLLDFFNDKNTNNIFSFGGLTQLYNDVEKDSLVFVVAGGDKTKIGFDYTQGLYGIAKVFKAPYDKNGRAYTIDIKFIYFFNSVITRDMFYDFKDLKNIPNIGAMTKGEKNQAISSITIEKAKAIMLAAKKITNIPNNTLFSLFPWVKDEYKSIATENYKSLIDTLPPALNVEKIAEVFAKYLMNYNSKYTTTLIGIFGMWGRGKTYFFDKVKDYIISTNSKEKIFYFSKFQPWKYQKQESAWAYLYQTILESYLEKDIEYLDDSVIKKALDIQNNLAEKYKDKTILHKIITSFEIERNYKIFLLNLKRLGATKLVFSLIFILMTAIWVFIPFEYKLNFIWWLIGVIGISGIIFMYKSYSFYMKSKRTAKNILDMYGKTNDYSNYLGFQNEIEKELSFLLQTYIDDTNEKLVLFIDDLDRCNEEIIIDIVDGFKLVLDNKDINSRLIVVTAVDERVLEKSIRYKYFNQELPEDVGTKEYIEKFFLMGIKLNQLNDNDIDELVDIYTKELNHKSNKNNENREQTEKVTSSTNDNNLNIEDKISANMTGELASDVPYPLINQSNNGDMKPLLINNNLNINSFILEDYEIEYIKDILKKAGLLTPRKINMFIHRYLIFKSLVLSILDKSKYENFHSKMLIEIVIMSQKKENLDKFIKHYREHTDYEIPIPLDDFRADTINRDEYIILIKFAEMVSPF